MSHGLRTWQQVLAAGQIQRGEYMPGNLAGRNRERNIERKMFRFIRMESGKKPALEAKRRGRRLFT